MRESELHAAICKELNRLGFYAVIIRAEAKVPYTGAPAAPKGWPDIEVVGLGYIEAGDLKRKQRDQVHQLEVHRKIRAAGGRVVVLPKDEASIAEAVMVVLQWREVQNRRQP